MQWQIFTQMFTVTKNLEKLQKDKLFGFMKVFNITNCLFKFYRFKTCLGFLVRAFR